MSTSRSEKARLPGAGVNSPRAAAAARPWRRWLLAATLLLLVAVVGYAGTTAYTVWQVETTIVKTLPPRPTPTPRPSPTLRPLTLAVATPRPPEATWTPVPTGTLAPTETPDPAETFPPGRVNILVLGTDKRAELGDEAARSDSMIVVSVDPQWKSAGILSVPRDLQVTIPGYGVNKINAAYFFGEYDKLNGGGPALAVQTVEQFFRVSVPYYIAINFDGFQKVIDLVGGIDVYIPEAIDDPLYPGPYNSYIHVHFNAGCQHLDGEQALEYARTRHADSDFGRQLRQQQVIRAVRDKALQLDMLPRYQDLIRLLGNTVETNIPFDQQLAFAQLAPQIKTGDIYSAQIDAAMVREVSGTGDLALRWDLAKPMLDRFFGRGVYAALRPFATLTPAPASATATAAYIPPLDLATAVLAPPLPSATEAAPASATAPPASCPK